MAAIPKSLLAALPRKAYQGLVSLLTPVDAHLALEVGTVGREGMLGVPLAADDARPRALWGVPHDA
ncbi:MAG TPA: hypothetical protein VF876_06685 [Burkholderiales bacterium]